MTGAAWLSSARVVRCSVKSGNERNPYPLVASIKLGTLVETAGDKPEEGGDDVKSAWPLYPGLHTCYNGTVQSAAKPQGGANRKKPASVRIGVCNSTP